MWGTLLDAFDLYQALVGQSLMALFPLIVGCIEPRIPTALYPLEPSSRELTLLLLNSSGHICGRFAGSVLSIHLL